jgi:signal transduction histidine kinase
MGDISLLKKVPALKDLPEDQQEWLMDHSVTSQYEPGDFLFSKGDEIDKLQIIVEGEFTIKVEQNGEFRTVATMKEGDLTGNLPYSRAGSAIGYADASVQSTVIAVHKDHFKEMIREHHELTTVLVHTMTTRVREFTKQQQQNEKLMSLGKLSAGLAHELNNPASAMTRSARELKEHLSLLPENFKNVISIRMSDDQVDHVNDLLFEKVGDYGKKTLSLTERSTHEDEIADWLEDHGFEDGYEMADLFVDFGFSPKDLDVVSENVSEKDILSVVGWLFTVMTTEKLVIEIEDSAERISGLVTSVKSYSHMDKSSDFGPVDIGKGITTTITMLNHKLKQKQIVADLDIPNNLSHVTAHPGQLNQVWTNLIDNAIDAMDQEGKLKITAEENADYLIVHIIDNGAGIPEEVKSQIFDPFFTTKGIGEGTGLGLDSVARIIRGHKAEITVESEPGKTDFRICFSKNNKKK